MTAIREGYVGDRTCNGLVADDGTVVALIADEKLTKLLGACPKGDEDFVRALNQAGE